MASALAMTGMNVGEGSDSIETTVTGHVMVLLTIVTDRVMVALNTVIDNVMDHVMVALITDHVMALVVVAEIGIQQDSKDVNKALEMEPLAHQLPTSTLKVSSSPPWGLSNLLVERRNRGVNIITITDTQDLDLFSSVQALTNILCWN